MELEVNNLIVQLVYSVHSPFQRTITLQKDSAGQVGFIVKKGQISSLVKDSSAARNGLLTHHYLCEVNGQNVIGLKVSRALIRWEHLGSRMVFLKCTSRDYMTTRVMLPPSD